MLSKLRACMCVFECVPMHMQACFVYLCAPRLCGSVTDRMRPLSGRCWGDNQYCSPRCVNTTLSCFLRREMLAEGEPGEYGHAPSEAL